MDSETYSSVVGPRQWGSQDLSTGGGGGGERGRERGKGI